MATRTRVKLTNTEPHKRALREAVREALTIKVAPHIEQYLRKLLMTNKQPDGTPRPSSPPTGRKYPATIKAYKRKGWDTEHYLIATGKSTELTATITNGGRTLIIEPANAEVLGYHIPKNERYRGEMEWMQLNEKEETAILDLIRLHLKARLN